MANTEKFKTLELVREAKKEVSSALSAIKTAAEAKPLEELQLNLEKLEGDLIIADLDDSIVNLNGHKQSLEAACAGIKKDIKELQAVADKVETAAKAIGLLVDIIGKATALAALA